MRALVVVLFLLITPHAASTAQDQCQEECSRCLVSVFGKCQVRGNDPVCEARKAACYATDGKSSLPGSPTGPGGILGRGGPIPRDVLDDCLRKPLECPATVVERLTAQQLLQVLQPYLASLQLQANGKWQALDQDFISLYQTHFSTDLRLVRYATNIDTGHGQAITIGNEVYFPDEFELAGRQAHELMFHELEHVVQYTNRGGVDRFLLEYIAKAAGKIMSTGTLDVHDIIDIESSAITKGNQLVNSRYGYDFYIKNSCDRTIRVALNYLHYSGDWRLEGWWEFEPGQADYIDSDTDLYVHTSNSIYEIYAYSIDGRYQWPGNVRRNLGGETYLFRSVEAVPRREVWWEEFTCH